MERAGAELAIMKMVHRQTLQEDIDSLARDRPARTSSLRKLDPFLDSQGMLWVGGRLQVFFALQCQASIYTPRKAPCGKSHNPASP